MRVFGNFAISNRVVRVSLIENMTFGGGKKFRCVEMWMNSISG